MTKAKISEYDAVAANNTDVNGVNIDEGCAPSGMNNMGREIMAALKRFETGADGDSLTVGGNLIVSGTVTAANTATLGNVDVNGGTIDGAVIGGASAAAGSFTTLNTSGQVVFNDAGADVDFRVEGDTNANLLFVDASADKVGIGTDSPAQRLHILGASAASARARVENASGYLMDVYAGVSDGVGLVTGNNMMFFEVNSAERMRIDSSGNVGIGTSSPAGSANYTNLAISGTLGGEINIKTGATTYGYMYANSGGFRFDGSGATGTLQFQTNGTERMRITSAGAVEIANGNLVFSTNGTGIDFSASAGGGASSSILDDYEEGTWTPVYKQTDGTVIATQTPNAATFKYTKIGNIVCLTYHYAQQVTNMTDVRIISGLPFAPTAGAGFWFGQFPYGTNQPSIAGWEAQINNGNNIYFVANQTLATANNWVFAVTYFI